MLRHLAGGAQVGNLTNLRLMYYQNGTAAYHFFRRLRTVSVSLNGVERLLLSETCDLPLSGDDFYVNY